MSNPLIQIDDLVREMTDEEHQHYLQLQKDAPAPVTADNETR